MSDTWSEILFYKNKIPNKRQKLLRMKAERERAFAEISFHFNRIVGAFDENVTLQNNAGSSASLQIDDKTQVPETQLQRIQSEVVLHPSPSLPLLQEPQPRETETSTQFLSNSDSSDLERRFLRFLNDYILRLPAESITLPPILVREAKLSLSRQEIDQFLQKFAYQRLVHIDINDTDGNVLITFIDHSRIAAVCSEFAHYEDEETVKKSATESTSPAKSSLHALLETETAKEKELKRLNEEIMSLLNQPSTKEKELVEKFKSQGSGMVHEFCPRGTREKCPEGRNCPKLHFIKITNKHTDESLGDCSFLNTCFHMDTCKFIHYKVESVRRHQQSRANPTGSLGPKFRMNPPQWIQCDLRVFDMSCLGKFSVVMADPPWDIHMELPYGTMGDDEMRRLGVPCLQDDGFIFLWVTGRAMELGRECLRLWGYERVDELVWVKTNQLQRIIRTGRTGHWLNHGKEHCLVGVKGDVKNFNLGVDCDLIVSEVRATSHKPDEIYGIIERLSPGTMKLELFGRPHNIQPNWLTLGNQLDGVRLIAPSIVESFTKRYPDGNCIKPAT